MTSTHPQDDIGPAARPPGPLSSPYRTVTLTLVGLVTIVAFESLAISTVMPGVAAELDATAGYGLAFSAMFTAQLLGIVLAGTWIERVGPVRPVWVGQLVFAGGSLVAGLAPSFGVLLAGRVVAGLGAGLVVVGLYVVVGGVFSEAMRPRVFAWISAAWVLPSIVGPLLAAAMAAAWSWRVVFLAVVPAVALTSLGLWRNGPRLASAVDSPAAPSASPEATPRRSTARTARLGLAVAVGAGAFQWAGTSLVPLRPLPVALAIGGLVVLAFAVPRLLPPGALTLRRGLPAVVLARGLFTAAFGGAVTFIPLMLVTLRGLTEQEAGVVLALSSIGWSVAAAVQGRERFAQASTVFVALGAVCVTAGCAVLAAAAGWGWPSVAVVLGATVLGVGMGLGVTSISVLTLRLAAPAERASASSAMTLSDTLGSAVGVAVAGTVFATLTTAGDPGPGTFAVLWATTATIGGLAVVAGTRAAPPQRAST